MPSQVPWNPTTLFNLRIYDFPPSSMFFPKFAPKICQARVTTCALSSVPFHIDIFFMTNFILIKKEAHTPTDWNSIWSMMKESFHLQPNGIIKYLPSSPSPIRNSMGRYIYTVSVAILFRFAFFSPYSRHSSVCERERDRWPWRARTHWRAV